MAAPLIALAALQFAGSYFASKNIKETAKLNRDIANMNSEFAELDAYDARIQGITDQAKYQKIIDKTLGEQELILAAQNIDSSFGSAGDIVKETKFIAELNKMEIEKQAEEEALGYKRQARDIKLNSFLNYTQAKTKASTVKFEGALSAGKTALSGYGRG